MWEMVPSVFRISSLSSPGISLNVVVSETNHHKIFPKYRLTISPTERDLSAPFLFAVDHCFSIRGQGTIMTGTVLQGTVNINDVSCGSPMNS